MGLIVWLVMGGLVGWVASIIMGTDDRRASVLDVAVGVVGALLGGWLIGPLLGADPIDAGVSITSILLALLGAIVLITILNLLRRLEAR